MHLDRAGRILRHNLDKAKQWHFQFISLISKQNCRILSAFCLCFGRSYGSTLLFRDLLYFSALNEVIWPKENLNYTQGLKRPILAIFQTGPGWPSLDSILPSRIPKEDSKKYFCFGLQGILSYAGRQN